MPCKYSVWKFTLSHSFSVDAVAHMLIDDSLALLIPKLEILKFMAEFLDIVRLTRERQAKGKGSRKFDDCRLWADMREGKLKGFEGFVRFNPAQFPFQNYSLARRKILPLHTPSFCSLI